MGGKGSGGRNKKTTAELNAAGGYRFTRHAGRADSGPAKGQPKKPTRMTAKQKQIWAAVIESMPAASIGSADAPMMCELIQWYGVYLDQMKQLRADPLDTKLVTAVAKSWAEVRKLAIDYGLTPQARAGIKVNTDEEPDDPIADLMGRYQGVN